MKIRQGFVSNSSSSSFVIAKGYLSSLQKEQIRQHIEQGKRFGMDNSNKENRWCISEDDCVINGYTYMDNFDMYDFLERIGVPTDKIKRGD